MLRYVVFRLCLLVASGAYAADFTEIRLCRDAKLLDCQWFQTERGTCENVPADWDNVTTSLATASNDDNCTFYT